MAVGSLGPPNELSAPKSKSCALQQRRHLATLVLLLWDKKWQKERKEMRHSGSPVGYGDLLFDWKGHRFHPGGWPAWHQWRVFDLLERRRTPAVPLGRTATNLAALNKEKASSEASFISRRRRTASSIPLCCHLANGSRDSVEKLEPSCRLVSWKHF